MYADVINIQESKKTAEGLCVHGSHEQLPAVLVWHNGWYHHYCDITSSLSQRFQLVLTACLPLRHSSNSKRCQRAAAMKRGVDKTRMLVTRVEQDMIGQSMPQLLSKCAILMPSGLNESTI